MLEYGSFVSDGLFVGHDGRRSTGFAAVAQSVEQRIRNAKVTSSIPVSGTNLIKELPEKPRLRLFVYRDSRLAER